MNLALWIVAVVLAASFAAIGATKLARPRSSLAAMGMLWVEDVPDSGVKAIGALEVAAAVGLVLPAALDLVPVLVPVAATGLVVVMAGATVLHLRRHEPQVVPVTVVLGALAAFVAWGRFGPRAF